VAARVGNIAPASVRVLHLVARPSRAKCVAKSFSPHTIQASGSALLNVDINRAALANIGPVKSAGKSFIAIDIDLIKV